MSSVFTLSKNLACLFTLITILTFFYGGLSSPCFCSDTKGNVSIAVISASSNLQRRSPSLAQTDMAYPSACSSTSSNFFRKIFAMKVKKLRFLPALTWSLLSCGSSFFFGGSRVSFCIASVLLNILIFKLLIFYNNYEFSQCDVFKY